VKKLPLIFSLLLFSCTAQRQITATNQSDINKYQQPYHIFSVGQWSQGYVILTLTDDRDAYFTVKAENNESLKKGAVYKP
jgi:hypothetical protein